MLSHQTQKCYLVNFITLWSQCIHLIKFKVYLCHLYIFIWQTISKTFVRPHKLYLHENLEYTIDARNPRDQPNDHVINYRDGNILNKQPNFTKAGIWRYILILFVSFQMFVYRCNFLMLQDYCLNTFFVSSFWIAMYLMYDDHIFVW